MSASPSSPRSWSAPSPPCSVRGWSACARDLCPRSTAEQLLAKSLLFVHQRRDAMAEEVRALLVVAEAGLRGEGGEGDRIAENPHHGVAAARAGRELPEQLVLQDADERPHHHYWPPP